jgi:hypothetical protein
MKTTILALNAGLGIPFDEIFVENVVITWASTGHVNQLHDYC